MTNHARKRSVMRPARRWRLALGVGAGAVAAAAFLGLSEVADARADTGSDVLGQAGIDLTDATQLLDGAPTSSLNAAELSFLTGQESLQTGSAAQLIADQEATQAGFPAADQSNLTSVDTQLVDAYQGILNADQTLVAADQSGDLTGFTALTDELGVIHADFAVLPADFHVIAADVGAELANVFGMTDFLSF